MASNKPLVENVIDQEVSESRNGSEQRILRDESTKAGRSQSVKQSYMKKNTDF